MVVSTQTIARQLLRTIPLVMCTLASEMRRTGYTPARGHFRLLSILAERPHHLSELAGKQAVSLPTMSSSITTLVERGWVKRVRDPRDRRMVSVELTPAGWAVLDDIRRQVEKHVTELLTPLSPAERERLSAGLEVLYTAFARAARDVEQGCGGHTCPPPSPPPPPHGGDTL